LTATDSANATATDTVTITITGTNDAPTLEAIVGGEVYESGLSTGTEPSTTTILASGILDYGDVDLADAGNLIVVDGTDIGLLTGNASHIYPGYTDGSHYGTIVFRGDGSWTYTLDTNIDNDSAAGASDLQGPDSFEVKIFDGTDYSAPQDLIINVLDDSPTAIVPEVGFLINKGGEAANDVRLDIDTNIDDNYGADQGGTVSFAAADGTEAFNTAGEVLTSGGATIYLYVSTDGQTLIGSTLSGSAYAAANVDTNTKVFTVELNTDGDLSTSTDNYSFTLHHQIDGGASSFSVEEGSYAPSGGNSAYYFFDDTSDADNDVLLSPTEPGSTINTSNNDFATGTGMTIGAGEGIRIDYVNGLSGDPKGAISYTDHYTVSGAGALIGMKGTSCSLRMVAYDDYGDGTDADPDDISIGNGVVDPITAVVVAHGNEMMTVYSGTISKVVDGITFTFDWTTSPDEVIIGNVDGATSLSAITADGFSSLEIHYVDGSPFTVNSFSGVAITPGAAVDFATDLNLTDADNDTVLIDDGITIQLSPEDHTLTSGTEDTDIMTVTDDVIGGTLLGLGGEDTLTGGASDDILAGGDGNDTIYGGAGNDTIYGGAGEDEIDAGEGNDYIDGGAGADIINAGEGDDSIVFDAADSHVDGEGEYDTLLVADDGILDFSNVTVHNVEKIDLNDDTTGQTVELTMQQVFDMTGDGNLTIGGVPTLELSGSGDDTVKINTTNWHQQGQTGLFTTNADGTGDAVMIDIADDATTGFSVVDQNNVDIDI
jgi:VCBS repeat-containing protein